MRPTWLGGIAMLLASAATSDSVVADVQQWRAAVLAHQPGTLPATTRAIGEWTWDRLEPVLRRLKSQANGKELLRGAALYLDLAVHLPLAERPVYPTRGDGVYSEDGRALTTHRLDSQIWTARTLVLAALARGGGAEADRGLARGWFRAVTAILAHRLAFADLEPHLAESRTQLPEDPGLLFDVGCAAETLASPLIQATFRSARPASPLAARLAGSAGAGGGPHQATLLAAAETHYRAVLERDPHSRETRVRLGRVLAIRHQNPEALRELQAAARQPGPGIVEYYNWLFLGDVLLRLQRLEDADLAFTRAAALYPDAASARLGISRVHAERGELSRARGALDRMLRARPGSTLDDDPRFLYDRCSGRDPAAVYAEYVEHFRRGIE
jgi:hypothetical protein